MQLRSRIITAIFIVFVLLGVADQVVQRGVIFPQFLALEQEEAVKNIRRCREAILQELKHLGVLCRDWSAWDDTYRFIDDGNQEYEESTLLPGSFKSGGLNLVYYFQANGECRWGKCYDLTSLREVPLPGFHERLKTSREDFTSHVSIDSVKKGIVETPLGPMMLVSLPILTGEQTGPVRGALVMGRLLDPKRVADISAQIKVPFTVAVIDKDKLSPPGTDALKQAGTTNRPIVTEIDANRSVGFTHFQDINNRPLLQVEAQIDRRFSQRGRQALQFASLSLMLSGALVLGFLLFLIQRIVINPILTLTNHAITLGANGDLTKKIALPAKDEVGILAGEFDRMVDRLSDMHQRLMDLSRQAAQAQFEVLESANKQLQHEVTERCKAQELLLAAATHDALTQLPNRTSFIESLRNSCAQFGAHEQAFDAVFFLDIDNFKIVNDVYGHRGGDQLLEQVAERLKKNYRYSDCSASDVADLAARFGGDEFVLLVRNLPSVLEASTVARRLITALKEPFAVGRDELVITTSIGIAIIDRQDTSPDEILRLADVAMYQAKLAGKDQFAIFDGQMHQSLVRRLEIETALPCALERHELQLKYQPIYDAATGQLEAFEALLRWKNPELGEITPDEFIPVAEETRLMGSIGEWVLRQACWQLSMWRQAVPQATRLRLSVNVSRKQLVWPGFLDSVHSILAEFPGIGSSLNFEITESAVMEQPQVISQVLAELRQLGIQIHMDDFGTGHSSLSCLHLLPIDVLKIDRSFVMNMESNADYEAVIQSIISLAHHLHVKVVAEGVESSAQVNSLRDLGCEFLQGFFFSRPVSPTSAEQIIFDDSAGGFHQQNERRRHDEEETLAADCR